MANIAILADDLTGACDTGVKLAHLGYDSQVLTSVDGLAEIQPCNNTYYTLNTNSRGLTPAEAYLALERAGRALNDAEISICYKKVDSVLRGNIGSELDALIDVFGYDFSMIAPALPGNGRTLTNGIMHVGGNGTEYTVSAADAIAATTKNPLACVALSTVRLGEAALIAAVDRLVLSGSKLIVVDAVTEPDLLIIATAVRHYGNRTLPAGSAGLAKHLFTPACDRQPFMGLASEASCKKPVVTIVGTRHPSTVAQVQFLKKAGDCRFVLFDTQELAHRSPEEIAAQVTQETQKGDRIVVTTQRIFDGNSYGGSKTMNENISNDSIAETVARITAQIMKQLDISAVIASGGDTAARLLDQLGAVRLRLLAEPMEGTAIGMIPVDEGAGILIATKSGGFGAPDALANLADYMAAANVAQYDNTNA